MSVGQQSSDIDGSRARIGAELGLAVMALGSLVTFVASGLTLDVDQLPRWLGWLPLAATGLAFSVIVLQVVRRRRAPVGRAGLGERSALVLAYLTLAIGLALLVSPALAATER